MTGPSLAATPLPNGPIVIGNRTIPTRYFLAPLAGYTQLSLRRVLRELGGLGQATTELVHAMQLVTGHRTSREHVATHPEDQPLSVQIFGSQVSAIADAARWLQDHGYTAVDLNMGCPMAKVNGQGGGARLMCDPSEACRLVQAVVAAVTIPVTVKMRLGWDQTHLAAPHLAKLFQDAGVQAVTIHGRTRAQGFRGLVDLAGIRAVVDAVPAIPVIGNGDVRSVAEAIHMREYTGCAAVAIGRGALLDPWIFRKIADHEAGSPVREPTSEEQLEFLARHFQLMWNEHGPFACRLFRKFAAWYGARLGIPDDLEQQLRLLESENHFQQLFAEICERHGERECQTPTALLKVPNGPVERW